ncbi:hypothetical protein AB0F72_20335 [Actinoplanes sp. NPDC023936]|uniref:hypothetical protein n=1 Tax=Actinoplanes sp. NPDC023936 TaxID=3154910 RepID=UPI0033E66513
MGAGSWVILDVGAFAATALTVAAWLFGMQGVEFASWFAAVSGVLVVLGTFLFSHSTVPPEDPPQVGPPPSGPKWGAITPGDPERPVSAPPAPAH